MNIITEISHVARENIQTAKALPFISYQSPEVLAAEKKHLFSEDWVFICTEADLPNPGDYEVCTVADEPIAVIRGQDRELRALSNVCRHRGALLLEGGGNTEKIRCPYHAWSYSDEGELKGLPFQGDMKIAREEHCLPRFRLEIWHGLVFVNLDGEAEPLSERFANLEKHLAPYQLENFKHAGEINVSHWQCNWKLALENFVESYHFFAVHQNTVEAAAPTRDTYYVDGEEDWSITAGKQLDFPSNLTGWLLGNSEEVTYYSVALPPNFVCNLYDGYLVWARVLPTGPDSCEIASGYLGVAPPPKWTGAETLFAKIFAEDQAICESVQQGTRSQRSGGGKLVGLEQAVVDFHQYLGKRLE